MLDPFLDLDVIPLDDVAQALAAADPSFDTAPVLPGLVELGTRLPSGLVHAESIWILAEPPGAVEPLAPGSPWYAVEQSLAVVLPPSRAGIEGILSDLARYHAFAARVARELSERHDILGALSGGELGSASAAELSVLLDAPPNLVASLDRYAAGLRGDLVEMALRRFEPIVRLHAALRTRHFRLLGARIAASLLARLPRGPFRLALSDGTMILEHLSPYVRDLGHALTTWGLENVDRLGTQGLAEALRETRQRPSPDLAALVVADLFAVAPELLPERRAAEATAGLSLSDEGAVAFGFADLARLALPDEHTVTKDSTGTLALIAGAPDLALVEALGVLLDTGRVRGLSVVLSAPLEGELPVVPDAIASDRDGARLDSAGALADRAGQLGATVSRPGCVPVDDARAIPRVAMELVGLTRRARVQGRLESDAPLGLIFFPRGAAAEGTLGRRLAELQSGRLALYLLSSRDDTSGQPRPKRPASQNAPGISRRFRA